MGTEDDARSECPKETFTTDENKTHKIIFDVRKVKLNGITDALKVSKVSFGHIAHEHLGMRKLYSKRVKRELTFEKTTTN